MIINNLDYIEPISAEGNSIVGSGVGIEAEASATAEGDNTSTDASATTRARDYGLFQLGWGIAKADAIGDDSATADTSVTGVGRGSGSATYNGKWNIPGGKKLAISRSAGWAFDF